MKKPKNWFITLIILLVGGGGYVANDQLSGGGQESSFNKIDAVIRFATNTDTVLPVKLLDLDSQRRYVHIKNEGAEDVYLYTTTSDTTLLSAQVSFGKKDGILLKKEASTTNSVFELKPENMIYGHIWVSSTTIAGKIIVNYK